MFYPIPFKQSPKLPGLSNYKYFNETVLYNIYI